MAGFFDGSTFGNLFASWDQYGVFDYLLPFLVIFGVVFGVLTRMKLFTSNDEPNKGINAVISISVALMAMQLDLVPKFFADVFPRLGVGLAVILVALVLLGLFLDTNQTKIFFWIGIVVAFVILLNSFEVFGGAGGNFLSDYWTELLLGIAVIGGMIAMLSGKKGGQNQGSGGSRNHDMSLLAQSLGHSSNN